MKKNLICPCGSKKVYSDCCRPFHQGKLTETALQLMRSRYSAYALHLSSYIIDTTHPENPYFDSNKTNWSKKISDFCLHTQFKKLEVLKFEESENSATVTFTAHLSQNKKDISFTEKSLFEKVEGKWLYRSGEIQDSKT